MKSINLNLNLRNSVERKLFETIINIKSDKSCKVNYNICGVEGRIDINFDDEFEPKTLQFDGHSDLYTVIEPKVIVSVKEKIKTKYGI